MNYVQKINDIDSSLSANSTNPVQNKVIYSKLAEKQKLYSNLNKTYEMTHEGTIFSVVNIPEFTELVQGMTITVKCMFDWYGSTAALSLRIYNGRAYTDYISLYYPSGKKFISEDNIALDSTHMRHEHPVKYGDYLTLTYDKLKSTDSECVWICIRNSRDSWESIYPIGSFYFSTKSTSPAYLFGGSWTQISGRFLFGVGDPGIQTQGNTNFGTIPNNYTDTINRINNIKLIKAGDMGGEAYHRDVEEEMPAHTHSFDGWGSVAGNNGYISGASSKNILSSQSFSMKDCGSGKAHNNMPPFYAVYIWERKA